MEESPAGRSTPVLRLCGSSKSCRRKWSASSKLEFRRSVGKARVKRSAPKTSEAYVSRIHTVDWDALYKGERHCILPGEMARVSQLSRRTVFFSVRRWLSQNTPRHLVSTICSTPPRQPQNTCPSCLEGVDHLEALSRNKGPHLDRLTLVFLLEKTPRRRDCCLRATL